MDQNQNEETPLLGKEVQISAAEAENNELLSSGIYVEYVSPQSGEFRQTSFKKSTEHVKKGCHWPKFVEPAAFLYYLAHSCSGPIYEQLITKLIDNHYRNDYDWSTIAQDVLPPGVPGRETCTKPVGNHTSPIDLVIEDVVQARASLWLLYVKLANTLPAVPATLLVCALGDRAGRRLGVLLPVVGSALKVLIYILAVLTGAPLWVFVLGALVEGVLGSHLTFMGSAYAYLADNTTARDRGVRFTILQTASALAGLAHTPLGVWVDAAGFLPPLWAVAAAYLAALAYIVLLLPESHPPAPAAGAAHGEDGRPHSEPHEGVMSAVTAALASFAIYTAGGSTRRRTALRLLLAAFSLRVLVEMGLSAVTTLFLLAAPLCLDATAIGVYNAATALVQGLAGLVLVTACLRCVSELPLAVTFMLSAVAGRVMFAFATQTWMLFLVPFISFGQTATLPLIRAMMSQLIPPKRQGALFATVFSTESVCDVFSAALFNTIYAATAASARGAVFLVQAGVFMVATVLLLIYHCVVRVHKDDEEKVIDPKDKIIYEKVVKT